MCFKSEALSWCKKYGKTNTDYLTALHAVEFEIFNALDASQSIEDIKSCMDSLFIALEVLNK